MLKNTENGCIFPDEKSNYFQRIEKGFFMGKCIFSAILLAAASLLWGEPALRITGKARHEFRHSGVDVEGYCTLVPQGVTGNAFRLRNPGTKGYFIFHPSIPRAKITRSSDQVKIKGFFKGRGTVKFGILSYNKNNKVVYPSGGTGIFTLDSPGKWVEKEVIFTPKAGFAYAVHARSVTLRLDLAPGGDILIDDLTLEFVKHEPIIER